MVALGTWLALGTEVASAVAAAAGDALPDGRVYEQSSPPDKNGGDVVGALGLVKAAEDGSGVSFGSTFGIPDGRGAQALPTYLARRGSGESGWSTQGLLPPPIFGERAQVLGWLPDFSETVSSVARLASPRTKALVLQSTTDAPARIIAPFVANAEYAYVGASEDASVVFFESTARLPAAEGEESITGAIEGKSNLYVWDRDSGRLVLAGALNDGKAPPKGGFAGPYDWSAGISARTLREGGAARGYYLQGTHAVTASGDVYFTAAGSGQLYLRENPTQPQSEMVADDCVHSAAACTIHVSASKRTSPDPAGAQPAAFQTASRDGSEVFFTSPEKLTDGSNTGPEQPAPEIGRSDLDGEGATLEFIPKRAVGIAVDGSNVYWANPAAGAIGRADLSGANRDDRFIEPGPSECEDEVAPGVFEPQQAESRPRYVAVDDGYVYWTSTGKLEPNGDPEDEGGTIGRAAIDGSEAIEPGFICGASNPQGIAVNADHIYWANKAKDPNKQSIRCAAIGGGDVEQLFFKPGGEQISYGIALSPTDVYFSVTAVQSESDFISRVPLDGGAEEFVFINAGSGLRGVAVDGSFVYWAAQGEEAMGRIPIDDFKSGSNCEAIVSCEREFVTQLKGALNGVGSTPGILTGRSTERPRPTLGMTSTASGPRRESSRT